MWLGIDFGTCYSSAAVWENGNLKLVKDPSGSSLSYSWPSSVYFTEDGEKLVGQAAEISMGRDINRYKREFKPDLGSGKNYYLGDRQKEEIKIKPEDLVAVVLDKFKNETNQMLKASLQEPITTAVITVPATYKQNKRKLMREAAQQKRDFLDEPIFSRVELLEEPVATAIYFVETCKEKIEEVETILVYDLGGGTFDATLIEKKGSTFQVLNEPVGLPDCGGTNFDFLIYEDLKPLLDADLLDTHNQDLAAQRFRHYVKDFCRDFKHKLSNVKEHEDVEDVLYQPEAPSITYRLSQDAFNKMIAPLIDRTLDSCDQLVKNAGIGWNKIDRVLLVGGSCRIPYVQEAVKKKFGRDPSPVDDPELAVCMGAAIYGAELEEKETNPVVCAAGGWAKYTTIKEALQEAKPGASIKIQPGVYREGLVLDKPVEILGDGPVEEIVIESTDSPCLLMQTDHALVRGLTLRGRAGSRGKQSFAVDIPQGHLVLENCDIISDSHSCLGIHGSTAYPTIRHCQIHDGKQCGVYVYEHGQGTIENCDIFGNAYSGVAISEGGNPTIRHCQIHDGEDGEQCGVSVFENGQGTIENCDIFGNAYSGVQITEGGNPTIRHCQIHDGKQSGVLISTNGQGTIENCGIFGNAQAGVAIFLGQGTIENCDIFGNDYSGVEIKEGGNPTIRHCQIHDGKQNGVLISTNRQGTIENCDIFGNDYSGVEIKEGGNPTIRHCQIHDGQCGINVHTNGRGSLENCDIFGNKVGVEIKEGSNPTIRHCQIHDGKLSGVYVNENGQGRVEDCDIFNNGQTGCVAQVIIESGGDPVVRGCKIHDAQRHGVLVWKKGRGTVEDCDIFGNDIGVVIEKGGNPTIRNCQIHDGGSGGVNVYDGQGTIENCDIFGGDWAEVQITDGGNPTIRHCQIHDGDYRGVRIINGQGTIENCNIFGYSGPGVEILSGGNPTIRRCNINRNGVGISIFSEGSGTVENCDLTNNGDVGWRVWCGAVNLIGSRTADFSGAWAIEGGCKVKRKGNRE